MAFVYAPWRNIICLNSAFLQRVYLMERSRRIVTHERAKAPSRLEPRVHGNIVGALGLVGPGDFLPRARRLVSGVNNFQGRASVLPGLLRRRAIDHALDKM